MHPARRCLAYEMEIEAMLATVRRCALILTMLEPGCGGGRGRNRLHHHRLRARQRCRHSSWSDRPCQPARLANKTFVSHNSMVRASRSSRVRARSNSSPTSPPMADASHSSWTDRKRRRRFARSVNRSRRRETSCRPMAARITCHLAWSRMAMRTPAFRPTA